MSAFCQYLFAIVILVHGYKQDMVIFCYCSHTLAVPLVSEVVYLEVSFVCWFWVIKVLFCVFWSLNSLRSWWSWKQGVNGYHKGSFIDTFGGVFLTCPSGQPASLLELFSSKNTKLPNLWLLFSNAGWSGFSNYWTLG